MKYKELEKIAEDNGYEIKSEIDYVVLTKYEEDNIIKISTIKENIIFSTMYACMPKDFQMLKASLEFAETPLEDRYEEKKYYLRHRFLNDKTENYLNFFRIIPGLDLGNKKQYKEIQTQFTKREIEKIKKDCKTDLKDFEQIEAEEE